MSASAPAAPGARGWLSACSVDQGGLPAEAGQLAGERDDAHADGLAPLEHEVAPAAVKALLGAPGDIDHARVLAALAAPELVADPRRVAVVVGSLNEQAPGVAGAGLGDRALAAPAPGGVLARDDAEEAGQAGGALEAIEAADLGSNPAGRQRVEPAEAAQPRDRRLERALRPGFFEREVERRASLERGLDRRQLVDVSGPRGGVLEAQPAHPIHPRHRPCAGRPGRRP